LSPDPRPAPARAAGFALKTALHAVERIAFTDAPGKKIIEFQV